MADTQAQGDLPELPEPDHCLDSGSLPFFTADQMREYGRLCVAAALRTQEGEPSDERAAFEAWLSETYPRSHDRADAEHPSRVSVEIREAKPVADSIAQIAEWKRKADLWDEGAGS